MPTAHGTVPHIGWAYTTRAICRPRRKFSRRCAANNNCSLATHMRAICAICAKRHVTRWDFSVVSIHAWSAPCSTAAPGSTVRRSEEHTSELQSLMRITYAVFCLKKQTHINEQPPDHTRTVSIYSITHK